MAGMVGPLWLTVAAVGLLKRTDSSGGDRGDPVPSPGTWEASMDGHQDVAVSGRTRKEDQEVDFADYMAARQPGLLRTAYLLTGNRADAEDLVQTTLAKLYLSVGQGPLPGPPRRLCATDHGEHEHLRLAPPGETP